MRPLIVLCIRRNGLGYKHYKIRLSIYYRNDSNKRPPSNKHPLSNKRPPSTAFFEISAPLLPFARELLYVNDYPTDKRRMNIGIIYTGTRYLVIVLVKIVIKVLRFYGIRLRCLLKI